jgi:iron(III) transport system ATP-binding protein
VSLVELRGLTKRYGNVTALSGVDLTIQRGTRTAVVGPSGSGKSTLLRLIAGFERPDDGEIILDGVLISDKRVGVPPHRRNIGLVMQDGVLFPHLTVIKNIAFAFDRATPDKKEQALALMDTVELHRSMAERRPHELSGGQQQRVALARALARRPRLMLLDEPFSALDAGLREQMRKVAADILSAAGVTTILVTHDQSEAMSFADLVVILRDGRLRQAGAPHEVYLSPVDRETAEFLGQAIVLDAVLANGVASCSLGHVKVDREGDGRASIMLRPEQVVLRAADGPAVNGVTLPIGRILAADFAGPVASVTLALEGAESGPPTIAFKTPAPGLPPIGARVSIDVVGKAHVFTN